MFGWNGRNAVFGGAYHKRVSVFYSFSFLKQKFGISSASEVERKKISAKFFQSHRILEEAHNSYNETTQLEFYLNQYRTVIDLIGILLGR